MTHGPSNTLVVVVPVQVLMVSEKFVMIRSMIENIKTK